jgi:hypothetical protein
MRRVACGLICLGLLAAGGSANDIRIFFGQPESVPPTTAFVPESHWGESAPPGTYTLGVWAEIQCNISDPSYPVMDVWNGIYVWCQSTGAPVTITYYCMDNFDHRVGPGTAFRWDVWCWEWWESISCISETKYGLGGLYPREFGYGNGYTDWWSYTLGTPGEPGAVYRYWLGNLVLSATGPARVWFVCGEGGVARQGGDPATDHVYFGETDPVPWDPALPDPFDYMPDFVFAAEKGDLNCDGAVDVFDIQPFVLALRLPDQYEVEFAECFIEAADCNGDGLVNVFDIDPFVLLLTGR